MTVNTLDDLLGCPPLMLDTTLDQLRTLLVVHRTGSALRAARVLGREQSSVQKQLDTLNRNFQALCGEVLVVRQGRGKDFLFTPTGDAAVQLADQTISDWLCGVHTSRRRLGSMLTVGTTEFTLPIVSRAWARLAGEFQQHEVEFKVVHVRTRDLWSKLETRAVDLVCGSIVSSPSDGTRLKEYDVIELTRGRPVLLTNLSEAELPGATVGTGRLAALPLAVPSSGLIADLLSQWYGPNFGNELNVVADIDDIYYGLSLLRSGLVKGCMIVTRSIGRRTVQDQEPDGPALRLVELRDDLEPRLEIVTGAFVRKADRERYEAGHPLNRLWDAVYAEAYR